MTQSPQISADERRYKYSELTEHLHYLRSTEIEVGLLLNFEPRPQVRRVAFENERKQISAHLRKSAAEGSL